MAKNIAQIFFNHMGYPRDLEDFLLPYIIRSLVILQDMFREEVTLTSLCECRLRFIVFLKDRASEDMKKRGMHEPLRRLSELETKIRETLYEIPDISKKAPYFEDFFFSFGREGAGIKLTELNMQSYMNGTLKILDIIESQPELVFRV
jgi:hypothetical protein